LAVGAITEDYEESGEKDGDQKQTFCSTEGAEKTHYALVEKTAEG